MFIIFGKFAQCNKGTIIIALEDAMVETSLEWKIFHVIIALIDATKTQIVFLLSIENPVMNVSFPLLVLMK